jgi:hypothetical protein
MGRKQFVEDPLTAGGGVFKPALAYDSRNLYVISTG